MLNTRLAAAMNNREFIEINIAEVFITTCSTTLIVLKIYQLIENSKKLN